MSLSKRGGWPYANPPNTQFAVNTQSPQSRGLVGWWPGASYKFRDYARAYDGESTNPGWLVDDVRGVAPYFDGTAYTAVDYAPIYNLGYQVAGPISVSFWAKGGGGAQVCFCFGSSISATPLLMLQCENAGGALPITFDVFLRNSAGLIKLNHVNSTSNAFDGGWSHIVWTDDSGSAVVYINGVLDVTDFSYAAGGAYAFNLATWGALRRAAVINYYTGSMSDMRIYNRVLSAAEVWALYNQATRWELYAPAISLGAPYVAAGGLALPIFSRDGIHSTLFGGQVIR